MKIKVYVHATYRAWLKEYEYQAWPQEMSATSGCGPLVHTADIEFNQPPREVLDSGTVAAYRAEQQRIYAEAEAKHAAIQQRINDLLCLEHKPDPQEEA